MRRLAKQNRKDAVKSRRDYQEIRDVPSLLVRLRGTGIASFGFATRAPVRPPAGALVGVGLYLKTRNPGSLEMTVVAGASRSAALVHTDTHWARVGLAFPAPASVIEVGFRAPVTLGDVHIWGLDAGPVQQPHGLVMDSDPSILNSPHLAPETFYLEHASASALAPVPGWVAATGAEGAGDAITLKKCAYCQRVLPVDPTRPATLAFHKHNAKRTGHQNECRACKKWRINDDFNPKRTVDQLHESSVITRERKLFLREPEALAAFKDRNGAGLKSFVWERFQRRCFRCEKPLELADVELDHTRPMAYLWPIDEHATCLCSVCNNFKKDRFPVDVYSRSQLRKLAQITGLSYAELTRKDVCQSELGRILGDIVGFAREWDPGMFNATARKVRELRPELDLFEVLRQADRRTYDLLVQELQTRPEPVEVPED